VNDQPDGSPYSRPDRVDGSFEVPPAVPAQPRTIPPVSPAEAAGFSRPAGAPASFAPAAGDRVRPNPGIRVRPVSLEVAETFGGAARNGAPFAPAPGERIQPELPGAGPAWWNKNAESDPWRDPQSPYWLAGPPVFDDDDRVIGFDESDDDDDDDDDVLPPVSRTGRRRFGLPALGLVLVCALVAGAVGGGVGWWISERAHRILTNPDVSIAQTTTPANRPPGSVADIARRVSPAVVSIDIRTADLAGSGSGVIIDKNGYILTNNHVVNFGGSAPTIRVVFSDKSSAPGKVVGTDPTDDLAVIKVDKTTLTVATLGNSDSLAVGDPVVAIGDPLGLRGTVTSGIVSALNRPLHLTGENGNPDAVIDAIQTDAPINPGNSGGALVDASGAVVGINTAILSLGQSSDGQQGGNIGVGFAIPINTARQIALDLIHTGRVVHASLGVSSRSVTDGSRDGAYLVQVTAGGPADKAGLKPGDVITLYDKTLIDSGDALTVAVAASKPGDKVTLHYVRNGHESTADVVLGSA
jgi:S1-C subfamily serine protease